MALDVKYWALVSTRTTIMSKMWVATCMYERTQALFVTKWVEIGK